MSDLLSESFSWVVPSSVLVASLVGSLHCLSMCGPLALGFSAHRRSTIAYQAGRFISYTSVGALAGAFGQGVLGSTRLPWLSELSLAFIALTLIYLGTRTLMGRNFHLPMPAFLQTATQNLWRKLHLSGWPTPLIAMGVGLLTIFLPCGHLYGFFLGAMATGHWWAGALFMAAFWLGTVPALVLATGGLRRLLSEQISKAPRLAGIVLICAGLFSVVAFANRLKHTHDSGPDAQDSHAESCH